MSPIIEEIFIKVNTNKCVAIIILSDYEFVPSNKLLTNKLRIIIRQIHRCS